MLGGYDYTIAYKPGVQHENADLFSRLPLPDIPTTVQQKQQKQKAYHDTHFKLLEFSVNEPVFV